MFVLNPQSGIPIYRQLVDQVVRLVSSGRLGPGDALPSVRELALEHSVNPMTISKAYALLEADGWLVRNRGKPMTVAGRRRGRVRGDRLRQLDAAVDELVLAARQLEVDKQALLDLIGDRWEDDG